MFEGKMKKKKKSATQMLATGIEAMVFFSGEGQSQGSEHNLCTQTYDIGEEQLKEQYSL